MNVVVLVAVKFDEVNTTTVENEDKISSTAVNKYFSTVIILMVLDT